MLLCVFVMYCIVCMSLCVLLCVTIIINNQVVRKIKIAVENDVKNWAYISLR